MDELMLAIETSNPSAGAGGPHADTQSPSARFGPSVAIARHTSAGFELLGERFLDPGARQDDQLMPAIDELARDRGVTPGQLTRVAVSAGPGGLTGLRVAVAAGQMIAEVAGARVSRVPTAAVARWGLIDAGLLPSHAAALVALASRGEETYFALVGPPSNGTDPFGIRRILGMTDAAGLALALTPGHNHGHDQDHDQDHNQGPADDTPLAEVLIGDAFLPAPVRAWAERTGLTILAPRLSARAVAMLAATVPGDPDPHALAPIYPREPEAVRAWRERHGPSHHP